MAMSGIHHARTSAGLRLCCAARARGIALLLVLFAVAIAATLAYTFVSAQATTTAISRNIADRSRARGIAETGLALAIAYVRKTEDWRADQSAGIWTSDQPFAGGVFTVVGEDGEDVDGDELISVPAEGDGDIGDDPSDVLTLTATGRYEGSSFVVRAVVTPVPGAGEVLFVVPDAAALTEQDVAKQTLMESWGYTVTPISSLASQAEFDVAVGTADVAFISEEIAPDALGTKLRAAPIGVISEASALSDDFAVSATANTYLGYATIDILDNTHPITAGLGLGPLAITTANTELTSRDTLASGASILAQRTINTESTLEAIDVGGALFDGSVASGRRVFLPWGGATFDVHLLTPEGKLILRQSLDWGAQGRAEDLLAHWPLDELSGGIAHDASGNGYDGVLRNMPADAWTGGRIGGALAFDGVDDYIEIAGFPNLTSSFTITAWVRPTDVYGDQRVFCDDRNNSGGYALSVGDGGTGRLRMFSRRVNPIIQDSTGYVAPGSWQLVVGVHDADAKMRYVHIGADPVGGDGMAYSGAWGTDPGPASIGGEVSGTSEGVARWRFGGLIDDVRVYNRALADDDIAALATGQSGAVTYTYSIRRTR